MNQEIELHKKTYEQLQETLVELANENYVLSKALDISRKLGSQFMGNLFRLMRLIDESGHHEIVDKFQAELCDEINKSLEKD